ncbi:hypothetical protein L914_15419 [Phytophthora nicotianae]|uniref:Uncharacterized protein n=1 Tax=Phytophthora nicotianae TaxID=4792 RepID=W2MRE0_PHYNI|nr:hypothetical protein L914_15419 [Phytophthora nicotianae]
MSRRRVAGMIYNLTNRQDIAGPLAALYLYHGSCCYSSARCVSLPLGDVVRQLMELEDYSCNLVNSSEDATASNFRAVSEDATASNFRAVSYLDDYIYRPKMLEKLNLYEFTSHCLGKRYEEVVPVLQTFRFPRNEGQASSEKRYKYAVLSLVLFKPFRCLADIVSHSSDEQMWIDCYDQWKPQRSNFVEEIMNNMEDFYSGFERAKSAREEASVTSKPESLTPDGDTSGNENDDLFHGDELDFDDFVMEEDNPNRDLGDLWTSDDSIDAVLESMDLDPGSCPTTTAPDDRLLPCSAFLGIVVC